MARFREIATAVTVGAAALAAVFLVCVSSGLAAEQDRDRRAEIRAVISAQLEAFRRDDGVAAFSFAAPGIRKIFGTPENFMAMVARDYAPVYRARAVTFLDILDGADGPVQRVLFTGENGDQVTALYMMRRHGDGVWRIEGCILLRQKKGTT